MRERKDENSKGKLITEYTAPTEGEEPTLANVVRANPEDLGIVTAEPGVALPGENKKKGQLM